MLWKKVFLQIKSKIFLTNMTSENPGSISAFCVAEKDDFNLTIKRKLVKSQKTKPVLPSIMVLLQRYIVKITLLLLFYIHFLTTFLTKISNKWLKFIVRNRVLAKSNNAMHIIQCFSLLTHTTPTMTLVIQTIESIVEIAIIVAYCKSPIHC